jgi:hypothetical protein
MGPCNIIMEFAMIKEGVTEDEVCSVIRSQGFASLEEVAAVVI